MLRFLCHRLSRKVDVKGDSGEPRRAVERTSIFLKEGINHVPKFLL